MIIYNIFCVFNYLNFLFNSGRNDPQKIIRLYARPGDALAVVCTLLLTIVALTATWLDLDLWLWDWISRR